MDNRTCATSKFEIRVNLTTTWKVLLLKEINSMKVFCQCTIIWNTLHKSFLLGMDTSFNWKMGCILMLCSNVNATINCQIDSTIIGTWSCKELSIAGSWFGTGRCFAGLSFVGPFENSFVRDVTTNWNVEEGMSLKDKALFVLVLSVDACISAMAFNAAFAELICFSEVLESHSVWEWTQLIYNPEWNRTDTESCEGNRDRFNQTSLFWPMPIVWSRIIETGLLLWISSSRASLNITQLFTILLSRLWFTLLRLPQTYKSCWE